MRKLKLLFMICLLGQTVFGQEEGRLNEPNIIPPSPTAYSLGKYGMIPVNMATGAINQTIPITVIKSKYLEVPVTLSYSTNGFKVDETASWVGQGWNLMAGGVITRVIRDEPDAGTNYPYPADITNEGDFEALEYIERANQASFDSEPDLYTFNFMGNSGSFVFERYNSPVLMPYQNIKIDREIDKTTGDDWFYITTPDGVKYTFGGNNAIEKSKITTGGAGCGKSYNSFEKTAWYLIKITHPTGDEITFEYESQTKNYISSVSQTVTKLIGSSGCSGTNCPSNTNTTCESYSYTTGVVLKRIKYSDDKIEFENSARPDILQGRKLDAIKTYYDGVLYQETNLVYETTVATQYTNSYSRNTRFWLKEVQEKGASTNHDKIYKFDYHNLSQVPPRFSFAQDHWGYFNAASNSDFVPTNTDIKNSLGQPLFTGIGGDREPNASVAHYGLLSKVTYPTGGYTEITYEGHDYYGTRLFQGLKQTSHLIASE